MPALVYCNVVPRPHPVAVIQGRCANCGHTHSGADGWCDAPVCGDGCCHCPCYEYAPEQFGRCVSCGQPVKATT